MRYSKEDVTFHRIGYGGPGLPAVNVKVRGGFDRLTFPLELGRFSDDGGKTWQTSVTEPGFTYEWLSQLDDDIVEGAFHWACEDGWEMLHELAAEIFGPHVKVWSEGRSGGWAVVEGLNDFDSWDAVDLSKWRRFEVAAEAVVSGIPRAMAESIYHNVWLTRDVDSAVDLVAEHVERELAEEIVAALRAAGEVRPLPSLPQAA